MITKSEFIQKCKEKKLPFNIGGFSISHFGKKKIFSENYIFEALCYCGHLKTLKWFYNFCLSEKKPFDIHFKDDIILLHSCRQNHIEIVKWLLSISNFDIHKNHEKIFIESCYTGNLELVKFLYNFTKKDKLIDIHACKNKAFFNGCFKNFEIAKWLYSLDKFHNNTINHAFINCCSYFNHYFTTRKIQYYNNMNCAKWLYDIGKININMKNNLLIKNCAKNLQFKLMKWLINISLKSNKKINNETFEEIFCNCCSYGKLKVAKWIYSITNGKINIHSKNECAFLHSCEHGYLDVAKWIYEVSLGKIDIHYDDEIIFRNVCMNGYLNIAKWLYNISTKNNVINIHAQNEEAFISSCRCKHLELAKWLYSLKVDIHAQDDEAFKDVCEYNNENAIKWLFSLGANIHAENDFPFRIFCENGNIDNAKWLYSLGNVNIHSCDEDAFITSCFNCKNLDVAKWLYEISCKNGENKIDIRARHDKIFKYCIEEIKMKNISYLRNKKINDLGLWLCQLCDDYKVVRNKRKIIGFKLVDIFSEFLNDNITVFNIIKKLKLKII